MIDRTLKNDGVVVHLAASGLKRYDLFVQVSLCELVRICAGTLLVCIGTIAGLWATESIFTSTSIVKHILKGFYFNYFY